ncbi:hypothetical protein [Streptomyces lichenis]|uniref:Uncharacterized protein n=1 Tax=Streptomyces lichenis TaxID=2306967 RepID=A0ABT0IB23_9ACTN|nr:hypothetical protein [Streptomyces lichenis]MCK8678530.1 hypothetical protein [Streptomyces lichenis]
MGVGALVAVRYPAGRPDLATATPPRPAAAWVGLVAIWLLLAVIFLGCVVWAVLYGAALRGS